MKKCIIRIIKKSQASRLWLYFMHTYVHRPDGKMIKRISAFLKHIFKPVRARLIGLAAVIVLIGAAGFMLMRHKAKDVAVEIAGEVMDTMQQVQAEEVRNEVNDNLSEEVRLTLRNHWLIAGFGLDSRDGGLERANSDVIMLADVNGETGEIRLASIYRDTCLKVSGNSYRKANSAYMAGGPLQAVRMLNENFDLEIDDYISVNWSSVAKAIDIMGGVDIDITSSELRYINSYITNTSKSTGISSSLLDTAGYQHLDGIQAVAYCRIRYTDSDFKRTERQRLILTRLMDKAKKSSPTVLMRLITEIFPEISSSIDTEDLYALLDNITSLHLAETRGFPDKNITRTVDGSAYVFPDTLAECTTELHEYLFGNTAYEPSDAVMLISARIAEKCRSGYSSTPSDSVATPSDMTAAPSDMRSASSDRGTALSGTALSPAQPATPSDMAGNQADTEAIISDAPAGLPEPASGTDNISSGDSLTRIIMPGGADEGTD